LFNKKEAEYQETIQTDSKGKPFYEINMDLFLDVNLPSFLFWTNGFYVLFLIFLIVLETFWKD